MDYICIDLKCFYASCECVERGLDPFKTLLVVSDETRGKGAICLAISPLMKTYGVKNRCRLFEIPKTLNYIIAKPRMKKYIDMSAYIYSIYLDYFSKEDIHMYSIDEAFIDCTQYTKLYKKTPMEIGKMVIDKVFEKTKITATCGGGTNLFLAKIAMDILAKHTDNHMAYLDEQSFKDTLWDYVPLTDFWQIGSGIAARLNKMGLMTLRDVANANPEDLYNEFGVNAEFLINHSQGKEPATMATIKSYVPKQKSLSSGQTLDRNYSFNEGRLVLKEMIELLTLDLVSKRLVTDNVSFVICYDNTANQKPTSASRKLDIVTSSYTLISQEILKMFDTLVDKKSLIRRLGISFNHLQDDSFEKYDLFTDVKKVKEEKELQKAVIEIKEKFGKSAVLRGMNLEKSATTRKRNKLIGGHNGE